MGAFTTPKYPPIPGLHEFDGPMVHTSQWDPTIDLRDKRVAVIGNGASAMQLVPAIADTVRSLTVFQRSRQWAAPFPKFRKPVPEPVRFLFREVPHYEWLYRLRLSWIFDSQVHETLQKDPEWEHPDRSINAVNDGHREVFTRYVKDQLADRPDLVEKVLPRFPPFGKRMLLDNGWYKTLTKPHVTLVDEGVTRVEGNKVYSASGEEHEVDVLLVATGYDIARFLSPVEVIGRGGISIREAWDDDDSRAYLGTVVPQFPNFFMLYGPNTALGHGGSFIFTVECQIDYVLSVLREMGRYGLAEVECRKDVYEAYNETDPVDAPEHDLEPPRYVHVLPQRAGTSRHQQPLAAHRLLESDPSSRPGRLRHRTGDRRQRPGASGGPRRLLVRPLGAAPLPVPAGVDLGLKPDRGRRVPLLPSPAIDHPAARNLGDIRRVGTCHRNWLRRRLHRSRSARSWRGRGALRLLRRPTRRGGRLSRP